MVRRLWCIRRCRFGTAVPVALTRKWARAVSFQNFVVGVRKAAGAHLILPNGFRWAQLKSARMPFDSGSPH
jgi:hypothetical protein